MHARATTEEALETTVDGCKHTLGCGEVDDVAVALEHIDLLDSLDRLDVQLLERGLELLVIGARVPVDLLDLSARSTLASVLPSQLNSVTAMIHYRSALYPRVSIVESLVGAVETMAGLSRLEVISAYPVHIHVSQLVDLSLLKSTRMKIPHSSLSV
jgi:hypothetical protein